MAYNNTYGNNWNSNNRGNSSNFGNRSRQDEKLEVLSPEEIKTFYKDGTKTPLPELFDSVAEKVSKTFIGKDGDKTLGVSSTQIRRIFDEVKRYEQILSQPDAKWEEQLPYIKMIKSKVAYTVARKAKKDGKPTKEFPLYSNLEKFLTSSINLIKDEKDYHVFVALFEAVYGFYSVIAPKDKNN